MNLIERPTEERVGQMAITTELISDAELQKSLIPELVPVYQKAFAGEPWFEVSRCDGCPRGFSAQYPGEACLECGTPLTEPAYASEELAESLAVIVERSQSATYAERDASGALLLASMAWRTTPDELFDRKYAGSANPAMAHWLSGHLPDRLIWLDEVFANHGLRPSGNLRRFEDMCERFATVLGSSTIAFRSINNRMVNKARHVFGERCRVYEEDQVPDWRPLVILVGAGGDK